MIKYINEEGFIKPHGIKNLNGTRDFDFIFPHIAIGIFSDLLLQNVVSKFNAQRIGMFGGAGFARPVYLLNYKNIKVTLFMAGISSPIIASDIEELSQNGIDTFIIFGNCGVLDKAIDDLEIIIPNKAFRDEGTSYHYVPNSESIELNKEYKDLFKEILNENAIKYIEGATWTTDAFYRETKGKMEYFKSRGAVCVEMEGASIAAVCKFKGLKYFTFYYAGDNLDSVKWEKRSLSQSANFDEKVKIPFLALELACKIENDLNRGKK